MKQEEVEIGHLSQMDSTNRTPIEQNDEKVARSKKNRRRSKEKRKARLLKFLQKLVKTCGLPSCRLMEQMLREASMVNLSSLARRILVQRPES